MKTTNTHGRILAIVAGMAFTSGGLVILMGDVLLSPSLWTQYHVLTILTVFGVIAVGELMATAWHAKRVMAACGFGVLFLVGTMLVVHNSVGRQAEVTEGDALATEDRNTRRAQAVARLAANQAMLDAARAKLAKECPTGKGTKCAGTLETVKVYQDAVAGNNAEIERLGPQKPVNAKADRMAAILAIFGFDEAKAKAALILLEPFLWCLFFEIGSIVSLGFAFRARPVAPVAPVAVVAELPTVSDTKQTSFPAETDADKVLAALKSAGKPLTNDELAAAMKCHKSESSKRAQGAADAGVINRYRSGKFVLHSIAL